MTLKIKSILSLLLAFLLTFAACSAAPHKERVQPPMSERILQIAQGMKKLAGVEEGDCLLNASDEFPAGYSVCDWAALACAVGGAEDSYTAYLHALEAYVKNKLGEDSSLGRATDYHRIALTVLALGGDPAAFSEDKNGEPVNLIEFGTYNYPGELGAQGLNAYIFALITLDSESYTVPDGSRYTRTGIIKEILAAEEPGGGFGLDKGAFDIDITAMALVRQTFICDEVYEYIAELAEQTRHHESVQFGISPRGALAVSRAAKAYAYLSRRDYVTADDVAAVFRDVCAHRLVLNTKARMRGYTETDVADEIVSEHKKPGVKDFKRR